MRLDRSFLVAALLGILASSINVYADVNVLIVGCSEARQSQFGGFTNHSGAFDPVSVRTELENILSGAGLDAVNVTLEDRIDTDSTAYGLARWFTYPYPADVETTNRWPNLRGEMGTAWDYVVLIGDPFLIEREPGLYALGVSEIAKEVAAGTGETVLLMTWPGSNSLSSVAHHEEIVYRVGRSGGIKVAPAGLTWEAAGSPVDATHPGADGAYLAAATIYSRLYGESAANSTYTYNDTYADIAHSTVTNAIAADHYTGPFEFENHLLMLGDPRRDIHFSERGTSTEQDIKNQVVNALNQSRVSYDHASYSDKYSSNTPEDDGLGWPADRPMPIAWNHGRELTPETYKEYVVNTNYWQAAFAFPYQPNTWGDPVSVANDKFVDWAYGQDMSVLEILIANDSESARLIPARHLWAQIHKAYPALNPLRDGTGPHLNFDALRAIGTYMVTLYSGRCPLDPMPDPMTSFWFAQKVGYETAWRIGRCQARAPGFKVLPSSVDTHTVTVTNPEQMTVQFIFPPRSNVTVNISIPGTTLATASPAQLTFTPEQYNIPQTVTLSAVRGAGAETHSAVQFDTVSEDPAFDGLSDSWQYTFTSPGVAVLPFADDFESYPAGQALTATNGWTGYGMVSMTNYSSAYQGAQPLPESNHTQFLEAKNNLLSIEHEEGISSVWLDSVVQFGSAGDLAVVSVPATATAWFGLDSNLHLNIYHAAEEDPDYSNVWTGRMSVP